MPKIVLLYTAGCQNEPNYDITHVPYTLLLDSKFILMRSGALLLFIFSPSHGVMTYECCTAGGPTQKRKNALTLIALLCGLILNWVHKFHAFNSDFECKRERQCRWEIRQTHPLLFFMFQIRKNMYDDGIFCNE